MAKPQLNMSEANLAAEASKVERTDIERGGLEHEIHEVVVTWSKVRCKRRGRVDC